MTGMGSVHGSAESLHFPLVPRIIAILGMILFIYPAPLMICLHMIWKRIPDGGTSSDRPLASAIGFAIAIVGGVISATILHYRASNKDSSES
jgi:hypothetical protein